MLHYRSSFDRKTIGFTGQRLARQAEASQDKRGLGISGQHLVIFGNTGHNSASPADDIVKDDFILTKLNKIVFRTDLKSLIKMLSGKY